MSCVVIMNTLIPWDAGEDSFKGDLLEILCNGRYIKILGKESTLFSLLSNNGRNVVEFYCSHFMERRSTKKILKIASEFSDFLPHNHFIYSLNKR